MLFLSKKKIPLYQLIPENYTDFHSHLLPGIDDGVKTIYQSAYILEQFEKLGVKKVITTPHVMQDVWPNSSEMILQKLTEMQKTLKSLKINIELEASAEYMMDDLFYKRLKINDVIPFKGIYLLVEMSTFNPPMNLQELLFEIKLLGYIPILAHPERYSFYHNDFKKYKELKELGFLFQLNLLSISEFYGSTVKTISNKLLNQGFYDFVGSDIHNQQQYEALEVGFSSNQAKKVGQLMEKNCFFS